ncbi:MAG: CDP-alcohol phosphatidyltransferase family protein [Coriobacteriia bacterium]|nr:CDP-alcohol phosphatidyltransferase family protein [Coriobacteriia bacterium]MBN2821795.1 CDP-alcohol phosphatidyltransferase family protein [Coriobacteriia bacterium]
MVDTSSKPGAVSEREPSEEVVHEGVYSVANLITILRLLLVPFFFSALVSESSRSDVIALFLYAIAASTDWVDGQIARRTNTVTQFGKIIDPLVDRLLLASGVVGLYLVGRLPLWIPVVLVLRDVFLLYGSYILERNGIRLPVIYIGKATTAVLLVGFTLLIGGGVYDVLIGVGDWFVYVGMALSLFTAVIYTWQGRRALITARTH